MSRTGAVRVGAFGYGTDGDVSAADRRLVRALAREGAAQRWERAGIAFCKQVRRAAADHEPRREAAASAQRSAAG